MDNPLTIAASGRRVCLGHDWLTGMRGGERVLCELCEAFPDAPIATLIAERGVVSDVINSHEIVTSFMQRIPGVIRNYRKMLPLMPFAATSLRVPKCDLFLTTNSCVAHAFSPPDGAKMLCYCFTPMRYAWLFPKEYLGAFKAALASPYLAYLRAWDKAHSKRVDKFVAISKHVKERILRFYGRDSEVVYPAVDTVRCVVDEGARGGGYDLIVSALVPYKKIDLAIEAYNRLGIPLKIVGVGGERKRLEAMAGENVEFLGWRSDEDVLRLYQNCRALVFPGEEDYGIVPLEAMACGKPVIAFRKGGATETVADGLSGVFFDVQDAESLVEAVVRSQNCVWRRGDIRAHAKMFGPDNFRKGLARAIEELMQ